MSVCVLCALWTFTERTAAVRNSSLDHGNLFHQAMEHLSHELEQRNKNWQDLSEEEAVLLAAECVDAVAERYQGKKIFSIEPSVLYVKAVEK